MTDETKRKRLQTKRQKNQEMPQREGKSTPFESSTCLHSCEISADFHANYLALPPMSTSTYSTSTYSTFTYSTFTYRYIPTYISTAKEIYDYQQVHQQACRVDTRDCVYIIILVAIDSQIRAFDPGSGVLGRILKKEIFCSCWLYPFMSSFSLPIGIIRPLI